MNNTAAPTSRFALVLGAFLLIEGIWGLFSPVVFGVLSTNLLHACIHVALGAIGLFLGMKGNARGYCLSVGGLLLVVGVLYFIPGVSDLIVSILAVNRPVAILNIVVGIVALAIAQMSGRLRDAASPTVGA